MGTHVPVGGAQARVVAEREIDSPTQGDLFTGRFANRLRDRLHVTRLRRGRDFGDRGKRGPHAPGRTSGAAGGHEQRQEEGVRDSTATDSGPLPIGPPELIGHHDD